MEEAIRRATTALVEALGRGDAAGAAALYADDGRLLTPAAELIAGRRDIEAYWLTGLKVGLSRIELDSAEVRVDGPLAVEIGRYLLAVGAEAADRGKYVVLHRRQGDGAWLRVVDVFNPDAPHGAPAARRNT
jgi:uncharacterized protein (TIGR02246 family)